MDLEPAMPVKREQRLLHAVIVVKISVAMLEYRQFQPVDHLVSVWSIGSSRTKIACIANCTAEWRQLDLESSLDTLQPEAVA